MKVVIFTQFYPPEMEPSGFMFHSFSSYLALSKKNQNVEVVCGYPNFPHGKFVDRKWYSFFRKFVEDGVNVNNVFVIPSDNKSNLKRIVNYTSYLVTSTLRGLILKSPDVVIATSPPIFAALSGLIVAKIKGAKFVLDVRDIWPESAVQMGSIKNKSIVKLLEWLEVLLYKHASLITVATPGMIDLVKAKIPNSGVSVEYVPCGVTIPEDDQLVASGQNPYDKCDEDKFKVLYAGLHGHAQNLTTIIDAANKLLDREDIVFYLVGAGPDKDRVVEYARSLELNNVKFIEPVEREVIRRYFLFAGCALVPLQDLDIFKNVFPSKTFELMSYGVPSIVGVGGEISKIIEGSGAGLAVSPENPEEYAQAITKFAEDPEFRIQVKARAIETAMRDFDYEVVNKQFEDLLLKICS